MLKLKLKINRCNCVGITESGLHPYNFSMCPSFRFQLHINFGTNRIQTYAAVSNILYMTLCSRNLFPLLIWGQHFRRNTHTCATRSTFSCLPTLPLPVPPLCLSAPHPHPSSVHLLPLPQVSPLQCILTIIPPLTNRCSISTQIINNSFPLPLTDNAQSAEILHLVCK